MAEVHGVAGEWARVRGTVRGLLPLFASFFTAGFAAALILIEPLAGLILEILAIAGIVWFFIRGEHRMESYFKGARGEEHVAGILRSLPDAYHVFNDFVACGHHIDHVVLGPAGVFAVETKFWRGKVTLEDGHILLDGQLPDYPPLKQVLKESAWVRYELAKKGWKGDVTPILAFASNTFEAKVAETKGAVIMNANYLYECLTTDHVHIPSTELERLAQLMESYS